MRRTKRQVQMVVRAHMTDQNAGHYVPVQKLTIAFAMYAMAGYCTKLCKRTAQRCAGTDCVLSTTMERLIEAIQTPSLFDENMNVVPWPKEESNDIQRTERRAEARAQAAHPYGAQ